MSTGYKCTRALRRAIAVAMLGCALVNTALAADGDAHGDGTAGRSRPGTAPTLLWLERTTAPGTIEDLAAALTARGVSFIRVPYGAHGPKPPTAIDALRAARAGVPHGERIAVGTADGAAADVLAAAREDQSISSIVLFDTGAGQAPTTLPAIAANAGSAATVAIPLLQVFDARCAGTPAAAPPFESALAFTAWLHARYGALQAEATRLYPSPGDARQQCRAVRDARFLDGTYARARHTGRPPPPRGPCGTACPASVAQTWLALLEDEAPAHLDTPISALAGRTLTATLADYIAAFVVQGNPNVRGRPQWPPFDDGARRYLHLGATVRATRDPLVDVLDLQAALDARTSGPPHAAPAAPGAGSSAARHAAPPAPSSKHPASPSP